MRIVFFSVFGFNIYSHGVFFTLATLAAGWIFYRLAKKADLETKAFLFNLILSVLVGVVVSRILFYFINLKYYQSLWQLVEIWQGGMVSFAGFIAGGAIFILMLRQQKEKLAPWLDIAGVVFPLAIAIGRIGCTLNGEFGIRTASVFAIYGVMPVTAFEIFLGAAIFALNFYLYLHQRDKLPKYFLFFNFIAIYSFARIFIDAYRVDPVLAIGLNLSQIASLIILVSTVLIYSYINLTGKTRTE